MDWDTIAKIGGLAGLALSFYNTLRQRWDRKPKLSVNIRRSYYPSHEPDGFGGTTMYPVPGFEVHVSNPTEKTIKVDAIYYIDGKKHRFVLPKEWEQITEVPSHDKRTMLISVLKFNEWAKIVKPFQPEKGRFLIVDALDNQHKSQRLGDSLSLLPIPESKLPGHKPQSRAW